MINEVVKLTKEFISVESTTFKKDKCRQIMSMCKQFLREYNFQTYNNGQGESLLVSNDAELKKFKVILNAHLDVVSGKRSQFQPKIVENKLFGRGAYDMKAAAATMIVLFKNLSKSLDYPIGLQLVADEEAGPKSSTEYQIQDGVRAEFVIVGEPTNLEIINKAKGKLKLEIVAKGESSHSAFPWQGENAIIRMSDYLFGWKILSKSQYESNWKTTFSVTSISTPNKELNIIPSECVVVVDIRYVEKENADEIISEIKKGLPSSFHIKIKGVTPSQFTARSNKYVRKFGKTYFTTLNRDPVITGFNAASDAKFYSEIGIPVILFGPEGEGAHSEKEWVDMTSLKSYLNVLKKFLISL